MEVTELDISYEELIDLATIHPGVIRDYEIESCGCIWAPGFRYENTYYIGCYLTRCEECAEEEYSN